MGLKIKTQKLTPKKSHAEFLSLKKSPERKQVCRLNFNRRTRTEHYQESSDCCCSYINQATQNNTCQVLLPEKNPGSDFFGGGRGGRGTRFGLKTGLDFAYRVWFSSEPRERMNVFIISVSNV